MAHDYLDTIRDHLNEPAAERTKEKIAALATAVTGGVSSGARYVYDALSGTFKVAADTASAADKAKDLVEEYGPYAAVATVGTPGAADAYSRGRYGRARPPGISCGEMSPRPQEEAEGKGVLARRARGGAAGARF